MKAASAIICLILAAAMVIEALPTVTPGEPRNEGEKKEERFGWWLNTTPGTTQSYCARVEEFRFSLVRNRRFLIVFLRQKRSKPLRGNRRFVRYFVVIFM